MKVDRLVSVALVALAVALIVRPSAGAADAQRRPNVVLILADDMGYGDPRCYNAESKIPTPRIDRLAAEGMRFTDAHTPVQRLYANSLWPAHRTLCLAHAAALRRAERLFAGA